jgi:hypothetical protein
VEHPSPPRIDRLAPKSKMIGNDSASAAVRKNGDYMNGPEIARWREDNPTRTTGWAPTCACPAAEPRPCLTFDPFVGSGTVGRVAIQHRRRFVGLDLNPAYIQLAVARTDNVQVEMAL